MLVDISYAFSAVDQTRKQELELRLAELDSHKEQLQTQRDQGIEQERLVRDAHEPVYKERVRSLHDMYDQL